MSRRHRVLLHQAASRDSSSQGLLDYGTWYFTQGQGFGSCRLHFLLWGPSQQIHSSARLSVQSSTQESVVGRLDVSRYAWLQVDICVLDPRHPSACCLLSCHQAVEAHRAAHCVQAKHAGRQNLTYTLRQVMLNSVSGTSWLSSARPNVVRE